VLDAARSHLTNAIALRFPAGAERVAWLRWLAELNDVARRRALYPDQPEVRPALSASSAN